MRSHNFFREPKSEVELKRRYKTITLDDVKDNPVYASLIKKVIAKENTKSNDTIIEPYGDDYKELATQICGERAGWSKINFSDPDFLLHLYKALRLKKIDLEQLASFNKFYQAINMIHPGAQFAGKFWSIGDPKGPVDFNRSAYPPLRPILTTLGAENVPENERCYLSIDFLVKHETFIFQYMLQNVSASYKRKWIFNDKIHFDFRALLISFIKKQPFTEIQCAGGTFTKEKIISCAQDDMENYYNRLVLNAFFSHQMNAIGYEKNKADYDLALLIETLHLTKVFPFMVASQQHRANEADSPLLSLILFPVRAVNAILKAYHGNHATYAAPMLGIITPRDICATLLASQSVPWYRPTQLHFPNITRVDKVHGFSAHPIGEIMHDDIHLTLNSANPFKALRCHFIQFFQDLFQKDMSRSIWKLTDMDTGWGLRLREAAAKSRNPGSSEKAYSVFLKDWEDTLNSIAYNQQPFWNERTQTSHDLAILINMVHYREKLKKLSTCPEFNIKLGYPDEGSIDLKDKSMHLVLNELKNLMSQHPFKGNDREITTYYILLYRLQNSQKGIELCNKLAQYKFIDLFEWKRTPNNFFELFLKTHPHISIDNMPLYQLHNALRLNLKQSSHAELLMDQQPGVGNLVKFSLYQERKSKRKFNETSNKNDEGFKSIQKRFKMGNGAT